jgi:hypothetical protein
VVAAAAGHPHLPGGGGGSSSAAAAADAAVLIGDGACGTSSSSSSHLSTGTAAAAGLLLGSCGQHEHVLGQVLSGQQRDGPGVGVQKAGDHLQQAESLPCYYYEGAGEGEGEGQEQQDGVGGLPLLDREEIQRMSSCSSGSTLALMQQLTAATAAAPAGCLEQ